MTASRDMLWSFRFPSPACGMRYLVAFPGGNLRGSPWQGEGLLLFLHSSRSRRPRLARQQSREYHADPLGDQCRLVLILDLHRDLVDELILAAPLLLEAVEPEAPAHPFAGAD